MTQGGLLTGILSKVVTGVLDEMVEEFVSPQPGRRANESMTRSATSVRTGASAAGESSNQLPLTDEKGRCMGCGNRCRPVKPNCKRRQKALAKWRPS